MNVLFAETDDLASISDPNVQNDLNTPANSGLYITKIMEK